jgi:hypothetical protein
MDDHDALSTFETQVPTEGYEWVDTRDGAVLAARTAAGRPESQRRYRPLSKPFASLFREFSELPIEPDAILNFANRYGMLGGPVAVPVTKKGLSIYSDHPRGELLHERTISKATTREFQRFGKPLPDSWADHIGVMKATLTAAARLAGGETLWDGNVLSIVPPRERVSATHADGAQKVKAPTPFARGMEGPFVATHLTKMLRRVVAPRIDWIPHPAPGRFRFELAPDSLIGCLWLQVAQALSQQKQYRTCLAPGCGRPIEVSRDPLMGARSDIQFCSDACKSRDYRYRKTEARRLAGEGKTLAQIAKALSRDVATIRRWV